MDCSVEVVSPITCEWPFGQYHKYGWWPSYGIGWDTYVVNLCWFGLSLNTNMCKGSLRIEWEWSKRHFLFRTCSNVFDVNHHNLFCKYVQKSKQSLFDSRNWCLILSHDGHCPSLSIQEECVHMHIALNHSCKSKHLEASKSRYQITISSAYVSFWHRDLSIF